jgi:hypothetical protein
VRSPQSREEETTWDEIARGFHAELKEEYAKEIKAVLKELSLYRLFLWVAVFFCGSCLIIVLYGGSIFDAWNRNFNGYISHETEMSERRDERDTKKFAQDSIMQERRDKREAYRAQKDIEKDKRDSLSWVRHNKQMDRYDALPDYKNER